MSGIDVVIMAVDNGDRHNFKPIRWSATLILDSAMLTWYRAAHNVQCGSEGKEFEAYVTRVLNEFHDDFIDPDAMGSLGDDGCDGVANSGSLLYACYGATARTRTEDKTQKKFLSDFTRAVERWPELATWRFVTNSAFGPKCVHELNRLQREYAPDTEHPIKLEVWKAKDDLWYKVLTKLSEEQLNSLFPGIPHAKNVELNDLVPLIESIENPDPEQSTIHTYATSPIRPVPSTKMDYNNIAEITRSEFMVGRLLAPTIRQWFSEQSEPDLYDRKAQAFRQIYERERANSTSSTEIVERLYVAIGGSDFRYSNPRATAVYAVVVFFFDNCDLFEEPPQENHEEGGADATADEGN